MKAISVAQRGFTLIEAGCVSTTDRCWYMSGDGMKDRRSVFTGSHAPRNGGATRRPDRRVGTRSDTASLNG